MTLIHLVLFLHYDISFISSIIHRYMIIKKITLKNHLSRTFSIKILFIKRQNINDIKLYHVLFPLGRNTH